MSERLTPDGWIDRLRTASRARLRVYIGAAPGVGKTCALLEDAHALRADGVDVVVGFVETHQRADTARLIGSLEVVPRRHVAYKEMTLEEMDLDAILARTPQACVVDELAHTNAPGSRHAKRYEDVVALLEHGISVLTAVNIQHLETLNDAVARVTGVRVRETVPDAILARADEVVNVDLTVEELQARLRRGQIYPPEKIEQALAHFFRAGNLSTLRELSLRAVADDVGAKAASLRQREGLDPAFMPDRVMVCASASGTAPRVIRAGARIAARLGATLVRGLRRDAARSARGDRVPGARRADPQPGAGRIARRDHRAREGRPRARRPRSPSRSAKGSRTSCSASRRDRGGRSSSRDRR